MVARHCSADIDEGRLEAELLYGAAAGWDRAQVIAAGSEPPAPATLATFEALLDRRVAHEPLAYILGQREFFGLMLQVGPGALVPRPETETLVEQALAAIAAHPRADSGLHVVDVGTGSGAIAVAVAAHAPNVTVTAIDASTEALEWADRNRHRFAVAGRVTLAQGDLLAPIERPIDILIANLPYIPTDEVARLPEEIRAQEPVLAVDGGEDGLELVRQLLGQAPAHLAPDAWACLLEVGAGQTVYAAGLVTDALGVVTETHRDLARIRRVVTARAGYPPADGGAAAEAGAAR